MSISVSSISKRTNSIFNPLRDLANSLDSVDIFKFSTLNIWVFSYILENIVPIIKAPKEAIEPINSTSIIDFNLSFFTIIALKDPSNTKAITVPIIEKIKLFGLVGKTINGIKGINQKL